MNLPFYDRHYAIIIFVNWLTKCCRLMPYFMKEGALSISSIAKTFFDSIIRSFSIPGEVTSNR